MKRTISKFIKKIKLENLVKLLGNLIILFLFISYDSKHDSSDSLDFFMSNYFDRSVITSIILLAAFNWLINFFFYYYRRSCEDADKLITSLKESGNLANKYMLNKENMPQITIGENPDAVPYFFPGIILYKKEKPSDTLSIEIKDSQNMYQLPTFVENHYDELFAAHTYSTIYNNLNIRVKSFQYNLGRLTLETERTTYFSSLVTNRAVDKVLNDTTTLREHFEPGPFLQNLDYSAFSNHLGFNIFIVTKDEKVIFVKRYKDVSVSKNTLGPSVAVFCKTFLHNIAD